MDLFHKIINLIDKNSSVIPEGDYLELCDTIKQLRDRVNPPSFLLDQNQPLWIGERPSRDFLISGPVYRPTVPITYTPENRILQRWVELDDEEEFANPELNTFLQDLHAEWSATDDGNSMNDIIEKFREEFITDRSKHNLPEETYRKVYEFYTQLWTQSESP